MQVKLIVDSVTQYVRLEIRAVVSKGARCSIQGRQYERDVADTCKLFGSPFMDIPFNTQTHEQLGGCTAKQDVYLNWMSQDDIGLEVKRKTPDWMQMNIVPTENGGWIPSTRCKIPVESRDVFCRFLQDVVFPVPPFLHRDITYAEWTECKSVYKDKYYEVPSDTIADAYAAKKTHYIQLHGYGLYHTGVDVCNFGVPLFACQQYIRVRCKRHGKTDATGKHIPSSVMTSLCPKLKTLPKSPFSLDNASMFPRILRLIQ